MIVRSRPERMEADQIGSWIEAAPAARRGKRETEADHAANELVCITVYNYKRGAEEVVRRLQG